MKRKLKIRIAAALFILIFLGMEYYLEFYGPINWLWLIPYGAIMGVLAFYIAFQFWMKLIESWP